MAVDHIGIAVRSLSTAAAQWSAGLGAPAGPEELIEGQRVRVRFIDVGETHLELLEPTSPDSPVARFLERRGEGLHHLAFRVGSVAESLERCRAAGQRLIDATPRPGARGRRVGFVHPSGFGGVLVEFVEGP